jgi:alpha-galactosidase
MRKDIRQYAGPDHWNDPDMMEVGNGMSVQEDRSHFTLWCMLAAPLIMGNDLRSMKKETQEILTNKEMIAVNQDALGVQALRHTTLDSVEIWVKPLVDNEWAVCFLNLKSTSQTVKFNWKDHILLWMKFSKRTLHPKKEITYRVKKSVDQRRADRDYNKTFKCHPLLRMMWPCIPFTIA